jgi:hypothetical protein
VSRICNVFNDFLKENNAVIRHKWFSSKAPYINKRAFLGALHLHIESLKQHPTTLGSKISDQLHLHPLQGMGIHWG